MTPEQLETFGNHIRANTDPVVVDAVANNRYDLIADWYNQHNDPLKWVFQLRVDTSQVLLSLNWDEMEDPVKMSTQRQFLFDSVLMRNGHYDPQEANNRTLLTVIFPGSESPSEERMPLCRQAMLEDATRNASYVESLFLVTATGPAGGDGSSKTSCAIAGYVGPVDERTVDNALEATAP